MTDVADGMTPQAKDEADDLTSSVENAAGGTTPGSANEAEEISVQAQDKAIESQEPEEASELEEKEQERDLEFDAKAEEESLDEGVIPTEVEEVIAADESTITDEVRESGLGEESVIYNELGEPAVIDEVAAEEQSPLSEEIQTIAGEDTTQIVIPQAQAPATTAKGVRSAKVKVDLAASVPKPATLKAQIEAVLFLTDKPIKAAAIAKIVNQDVQIVRQAIIELISDYEAREGGLEIAQDNGYVVQVKDEYAHIIEEFSPNELSHALLRTLSAIAIKQPVMQSEIIRIRGAGAYEHVRELMEKELINKEETGRSPVLTTTKKFQEYFRLTHDAKDLRGMIKKQDRAEAKRTEDLANADSQQLSLLNPEGGEQLPSAAEGSGKATNDVANNQFAVSSGTTQRNNLAVDDEDEERQVSDNKPSPDSLSASAESLDFSPASEINALASDTIGETI
jgi:segregation and condensation protein B